MTPLLTGTWLFMFSAYFDASGGPDQHATVVGGYLATVEEWERFDVDWRLLLAKEDLPYFHMKEFTANRKVFSTGWDNETRRSRFLRQLSEIIAAYVRHSFSWSVVHRAFVAIDKKYDLSSRVGNPYCFCARGCAAKIRMWLDAQGYRGEPIEYIFEAGDKGRGILGFVFERDNLPMPQFKPKLPPPGREKELFTPLQAADFLAWEHQKHIRLYETNTLLGYRKSFEALERVPNTWIFNEDKELEEFCRRGNVALRNLR